MTDTFACLIAGSISSLHGNEIIKSSIQAALPFLSMPIPLYRLSEIHSKNVFPVFFRVIGQKVLLFQSQRLVNRRS